MTIGTNGDGAWTRRFHPAGETAPLLVCFPHAGGAANFYHPLSAALTPDVDVRAVQYPGRQNRYGEAPIDDIGVLSERIFEALTPTLRARPVLFGHSMGAVVAFEVARRMERILDVPPAALIASGRRPPDHRSEEEYVHLREDDGLIEELKALGGVQPELFQDDELLRLLLPMIRSDYRAIETYRGPAETTLSCPVVVMAGDRDPRLPVPDAHGWREHTTGEFSMDVFDGGHFYLADWPAEIVARIAGVIRTAPCASFCAQNDAGRA